MASDPALDVTADGRVIVVLEPGTPVTGLWCEACLLPSLVSIPIVALGRRGVTDYGWADVCTECGAERWIQS